MWEERRRRKGVGVGSRSWRKREGGGRVANKRRKGIESGSSGKKNLAVDDFNTTNFFHCVYSIKIARNKYGPRPCKI